MAVAALTEELLSFEPALADDFLLDKQLKSIRQTIEKANPALIASLNLDVCFQAPWTITY